ncbi:signal peptide peptidase SppA [Aerosticca soli]|uniref:Protease IV n=1 Tax=Aerosticca soli TaxID=2010829 RepID=A0A2Z6E950_9GAMM|nr:signal peptide peptidase SppA [Aerosticca soli]BBD81238.1 protease IV [Aerosticca soli]
MSTPPPLPSRRPHGFRAFLRRLGRGLNLVRLVILNLVFFGLLALVALLVLGGIAGNRLARTVQDNSVLVLKLKGTLVEQYSLDPLQRTLAGLSGDAPRQVQVRDLVAAIDAAAGDARITRLLLMPEDLHAGGFAALREVGAALDRFRARGKPVIAWGVNLEQGPYYLAAHADRILLDPQGGVMLTGLANYRLFYKNLLDRLGVDVHLFRVGQYKSAAEPFVQDHASPEAKEADRYWMGGLWDEYLVEVAARRGMTPANLRALIDGLPERIGAAQGDLARLAVAEHLADATATRAELEAWMRGQGVPPGKRGEGFRQIAFGRYLAGLGHADALRPGVAVVVAEGEISPGQQPQGEIGGDSTAALIRAARLDRRTRALVLRIDSPGGEVYAAEQIRREVELTRAAGIPVVVSMGDVAASGGYWIGMNAERIYAEPNTITGSIGIFGLYYTIPGTLDKVGVKSDGVATGPLAGAFDITRPLDPRVAALIQAVIDKGYRDFVGRVAKARGKDYASIDAVAQGRVWTGRQALERGLVDRLGGLREAIADAAERAKMGDHYGVRYVERPLGGLSALFGDADPDALEQALAALGLPRPAALARLAGRRLAPLELLRRAPAGRPNVYAHCYCAPPDGW